MRRVVCAFVVCMQQEHAFWNRILLGFQVYRVLNETLIDFYFHYSVNLKTIFLKHLSKSLNKTVYLKNIFLISLLKHKLWALKITVSMSTKTHFPTDG